MGDGRRPARTQSNGYIPQPPIENGETPYGSIAEAVTTIVVDGLKEREPLYREALHALISALDLNEASMIEYLNSRIIKLYRETTDITNQEVPFSIQKDPFSVARAVVRVEAEIKAENERDLGMLVGAQ